MFTLLWLLICVYRKEQRLFLTRSQAIGDVVDGRLHSLLKLTMYYSTFCVYHVCTGDPVSVNLDRQREWDETIRLHFYNQDYNQDKELFYMVGMYTPVQPEIS